MIIKEATLSILAVWLAAVLSPTNIAIAQISEEFTSVAKQEGPPDRNTPRDPEHLGTRGPCDSAGQLRVFAPSSGTGLTVAEHPTFWFYIPAGNDRITSGKLVVESQSTTLYRLEFDIPDTAGFIRISLPSTGEALALNQVYNWTLTIDCALLADSDSSSDPGFVSLQGKIQRITADSLPAVGEPISDRFTWYQNHGIWHFDSTDSLLTLRASNPQAWENLLRAVGMADLLGAEIYESVQLPSE